MLRALTRSLFYKQQLRNNEYIFMYSCIFVSTRIEFTKPSCTYCQEDIVGLRIHCADCEDFELCPQVRNQTLIN